MGKFIAPGIAPRANSLGERTSRSGIPALKMAENSEGVDDLGIKNVQAVS